MRYRLREIFLTGSAAKSAALLNDLLGTVTVIPRLTDHDGYPWHIHYFPPGAAVSEHLVTDGAMALAVVITTGEHERLQVCAAPRLQPGPRRPVAQPVQALLRQPYLRQPPARRGLPRAPPRRRQLTEAPTTDPSGLRPLGRARTSSVPLLEVHAVQPQQVLAEDLALGGVGELGVAVPVARSCGISKSMNARSAHCGWKIGASEP